MYESENLEAILPEDIHGNHLSTLDKSALQQYKLSLRTSNILSNTLLNDAWSSNREKFNETAVNQIMNSAKVLLQNVDLNTSKTWRSSLSNYTDPVQIFEKSSANCQECAQKSNYKGLEDFHETECKCNLGLKTNLSENKPFGCSKPVFGKDKEGEYPKSIFLKNYDEKLFKPKFGRQKHVMIPDKTSQAEPKVEYIDLDKIEEENKAHKSNVAKITFKTAKEQLLASNPAAKRTLGASRKAQGKFVSPMIGAQEKQEPNEPIISDERLKHLDPKMVELIESEIIDKGSPVGWEDIAGLQLAKSTIQEAVVWPLLRPDIFTGLRRPPKGILLFGPPGTGKTLIGKCVAAQCHATFFSISASSLTSKWIGDGEKMVRALFAVARCRQPAVIFIDEIDSLLTQRSDSEHEATRRIKTEFLVQFDGAATEEEDRLLIVGATNRPQELDEAARRRLVKRLYIPLPDADARKQIITNLLRSENNELSEQEVEEVARLTSGYSGADMKSLCSEAAMGPVRAVPLSQIVTIHADSVRAVCAQDFINALQRVRPSVSQDDLGQYVKWNETYGQGF